MKQILLYTLVLFFTQSVNSQFLVSCMNTYSEVYGGMEDGGVSRNESYFFKVLSTVELQDIYVDGERLRLKRGDTLVVNLSIYKPYQQRNLMPEDTVAKKLVSMKLNASLCFVVYQDKNRYYASMPEGQEWSRSVIYKHGRKIYTASAKEGFDSGQTSYAP